MPVEGSEDQIPSSFSSPGSAALTPGGADEDGAIGGSFPENNQGSEAAAAYPANTGPEEGNSSKPYSHNRVEMNAKNTSDLLQSFFWVSHAPSVVMCVW